MANGKKKFWIGTLVGGVVGSVAALLLAPKSGRELRADIAEGAQQLNEKTQRLAKQIEEQKIIFWQPRGRRRPGFSNNGANGVRLTTKLS